MASILLAVILLAGCGPVSETSAVTAVKAALKNRNSKDAVVRAKAALTEHPSSPELRLLLGAALLEAGDYIAAEVELRKAKALGISPNQWAPPLARAMLLRLQFKRVVDELASLKLDDPAARADLDTAVAASFAGLGDAERAKAMTAANLRAVPDHVPTQLLRARLLARPDTLDEALGLVDSVLTRDAANGEAWQLAGDLQLFGKGDLLKAEAAYHKVLSNQPTDVSAHSSLILLHMAKSDLGAARRQLELLREAQPRHPQTTYLTARINFLDGQAIKARELIQQLLRTAPNNVAWLEFAAAVELKLNSPRQAEIHLVRALAESPQLPVARRLLTEAYLRAGKPQKAIEAIRPNLDGPAPDAMSFNLAAEAYMLSGDIAKAEEFFKRASAAAPQDSQYKTAVALISMSRNRPEQAFAELRNIAASTPDIVPDMSLIQALLRRNRLDEALQAIDGLEQKVPEKPTAANLRGRVQMLRRDLAGARQSFEKALAKDPIFLPAIASLAAIDLAEGKPDSAENRYESILKIDPKSAGAYLALADLKRRANAPKEVIVVLLDKAVQTNPSDSAPRLALISHLLGQREMKSALTAAQTAVAAIPDNPELLEVQGNVQLAAGEVSQAITTYNKASGLSPKSIKILLRLADAYHIAKDNAAAERAVKRALGVDPTDITAQRALIVLSARTQQPQRALGLARDIQSQHPNSSVGFAIEGDLHLESKNTEAAIKAYRKGLSLANPGSIPTRLYAALLNSKDTVEAARFASDWIRQHPNDLVLRLYLANRALLNEDLPVAEDLYTGIVKVNPRVALAWNNLAWVTAKLGKPGATEMAQSALKLEPENPQILDTLAFAHATYQQWPQAIQALRSAIAQSPDEPALRLNLAKTLLKSGDTANSKAELSRLAKLGVAFPQQAEVSDLLRKLE